MGGDTDRWTVHYGIELHYDYKCIWKIFSIISLYSHCTDSVIFLCRRTKPEYRKKFFKVLCSSVSGRSNRGACLHYFSLFASSPPVVDPDAAAVTMVWSYIGELIFNMLVLVGAVKMSDRVVREMMGL